MSSVRAVTSSLLDSGVSMSRSERLEPERASQALIGRKPARLSSAMISPREPPSIVPVR